MPLKLSLPNSMDECVYFTRRSLDDGSGGFAGKAVSWVLKEDCPKCHKAKMGKPRGKDGHVMIRATEYVCPHASCAYTVAKKDYEDTLTCNIIYTCPYCKKAGETQVPYVRKTFDGVKAVVFDCQHCKKKLGISKKMKTGKSMKGDDDDADDADDV